MVAAFTAGAPQGERWSYIGATVTADPNVAAGATVANVVVAGAVGCCG